MTENEVKTETHPAEPILAALGMFTYAWSSLQKTLETTIWLSLELNSTKGRIITSSMQMSSLIDMLQTILSADIIDGIKNDQTIAFSELIDKIRTLNSQRVDIMHSNWRMPGEKDDYKTMQSSRTLARGKLKSRDKTWTKNDLLALSIEVTAVADALMNLNETVILANRPRP